MPRWRPLGKDVDDEGEGRTMLKRAARAELSSARQGMLTLWESFVEDQQFLMNPSTCFDASARTIRFGRKGDGEDFDLRTAKRGAAG